jgi:hypothetical protein
MYHLFRGLIVFPVRYVLNLYILFRLILRIKLWSIFEIQTHSGPLRLRSSESWHQCHISEENYYYSPSRGLHMSYYLTEVHSENSLLISVSIRKLFLMSVCASVKYEKACRFVQNYVCSSWHWRLQSCRIFQIPIFSNIPGHKVTTQCWITNIWVIVRN